MQYIYNNKNTNTVDGLFKTKYFFLGLIIFFVSIFGIINAQAANETEVCRDVPHAAFIRHPRGCNAYYVCWHGRPHARECPVGYKFDVSGICDYPQFVNCGTCSPYGSSTIRVEGSCSRYIECRNGAGRLSECRRGLLFDVNTGTCREAHLVDCTEREPIITSKFYY